MQRQLDVRETEPPCRIPQYRPRIIDRLHPRQVGRELTADDAVLNDLPLEDESSKRPVDLREFGVPEPLNGEHDQCKERYGNQADDWRAGVGDEQRSESKCAGREVENPRGATGVNPRRISWWWMCAESGFMIERPLANRRTAEVAVSMSGSARTKIGAASATAVELFCEPAIDKTAS